MADRVFRRGTVRIGRRLARIGWITPNRVSFAAFILGGIVAAFFVLTGILWAAGLASALSYLLDYLDGDVARAQGTTSKEGDILDGVLDRYTDALLIAALMYVTSIGPKSSLPFAGGSGVFAEAALFLVGFAALLGCLLPSYVRAVATANGKPVPQSVGGRGTRNVVTTVGLVLGQPVWLLITIALIANVTALHRAIVAVRR